MYLPLMCFGRLRRSFSIPCRALAFAGAIAVFCSSPLPVCAASEAGAPVPAAPAREILRDTPKYDKALLQKEKTAKAAKAAPARPVKKETAAPKSKTANKTQPKAAAKKPTAAKTPAKKAAATAKTPPQKSTAAAPKGKAQPKPVQPAPATKAVPAATTAGTAAPERITFPASRVAPIAPEKGARLTVADTWMPLLRRLNKDGVDMGYLRAMFGRMGDAYSHEPMGTKVNELFSYKFVPRPPRKAAAQPSATPPVYKKMVTPESIAKCQAYLETHKTAFARMEEVYGVPKEVVAGLLMVETRLGTFLGHNSSFWSLACMAAADTPDRVAPTVEALPLPMTPDKEAWLQQILRERSTWAYKELLALIKHSMANGIDPLGMPGSVYGAIGICQFMPSNLPKFAVDGNKDGKIDLFDPADAIPSVGNYLKEHGWAGKEVVAANRDVHHKTLKRYNKSNVYANTILAIAEGVAAPATAVTADASKAAPQAVKKGQSAPGKPAGKAAVKPAAKPSGKKQPAAKTGKAAPAKGSKATASGKAKSSKANTGQAGASKKDAAKKPVGKNTPAPASTQAAPAAAPKA